jgi:hypothetical protein
VSVIIDDTFGETLLCKKQIKNNANMLYRDALSGEKSVAMILHFSQNDINLKSMRHYRQN